MAWRTVRRNVELLTELHNLPAAERRRLGQQAIDLVGLNGFENHYPKSLSGGMRMRCSLARTLTLRPPIMMFDEPFGAVDEITREHLNEETLRLFDQEGFAGLFITHSISEAVFMSTRVLVMSARPGRIVADYPVPFRTHAIRSSASTPEFAALSGELSRALRGGHTHERSPMNLRPTDAALAASPVVIEAPTVRGRTDEEPGQAHRCRRRSADRARRRADRRLVLHLLPDREAALPAPPAPRRGPGGLPEVGEPPRDPRRALVHHQGGGARSGDRVHASRKASRS